VERAERAVWQRAFAIDRATEAVDDAPGEARSDIDACGAACGDDFAACVDFLHFAEGHEENAVVAEAHDLGLEAREAVRADFADIAEGNARADRFDDEAGDLNYLTHAGDRGGRLDAAAQGLHERGEDG
jgi:hypothetical protein